MTQFKRILTLIFVMICLAVSTFKADTYEPNGEPKQPDQGWGTLYPRQNGNKIQFMVNGKNLWFFLEEVRGDLTVTCRNVRSGKRIYSTITADNPELELPSGGIWEIEAVNAWQQYYGKVNIKELAQF